MMEAICLATVGNVFDDGLTLIFDGQTDPSKKHYKRNKSINFAAGQRVVAVRISGTYIVAFPVG